MIISIKQFCHDCCQAFNKVFIEPTVLTHFAQHMSGIDKVCIEQFAHHFMLNAESGHSKFTRAHLMPVDPWNEIVQSFSGPELAVSSRDLRLASGKRPFDNNMQSNFQDKPKHTLKRHFVFRKHKRSSDSSISHKHTFQSCDTCISEQFQA